MFAIPYNGQWQTYFNGLYRFVELLPQPIQRDLLVRLHPSDQGWSQTQRWKDRFDWIQLDEGRGPMGPAMARARLCICTYNATTYLDTFAADLPTVIFWNPEQWELRPSATADFEALKRAGVFHETPESAADHVAAIWDDIDGWWKSPEVTEAVRTFSKRYCDRPADLVARIETVLKRVIARGSSAQ
jgi:putative transferase (TIGR04331 family)